MTTIVKSILFIFLSCLILPAYAQHDNYRHYRDGRGYHHWDNRNYHHHHCYQQKQWVSGHWVYRHRFHDRAWVPGHWVWVRWCR